MIRHHRNHPPNRFMFRPPHTDVNWKRRSHPLMQPRPGCDNFEIKDIMDEGEVGGEGGGVSSLGYRHHLRVPHHLLTFHTPPPHNTPHIQFIHLLGQVQFCMGFVSRPPTSFEIFGSPFSTHSADWKKLHNCHQPTNQRQATLYLEVLQSTRLVGPG
jgi:hypothetical protein